MRYRWTTVVLVLPGLLALADPAWSQDASVPARQLRLSKVTELNSATAPVVPSFIATVVRFSTGEFVVSYEFTVAPQVVLFDANGKFVRMFDKVGKGPGELSGRPILAIARDTLYAFEGNRLVRLDRSLRAIDTRTLPVIVWSKAIVLNDGSMVTSGHGNRKTTHNIVHPDLTHTPSKDSTQASLNLASRTDGGFWLVRSNSQELEHHAPDGTRLRTVTLHRPWWQSYDPAHFRRPMNIATVPTGRDRLMVVTWVPDPNDRSEPPRPNAVLRPSLEDASKVLDTIVEIVSESDGSLIATGRNGLWLNPVAGTTDLLFSTREIEDGHIVIDVWRVAIR